MKKSKIRYSRFAFMCIAMGLSLFLTSCLITIVGNIIFFLLKEEGFITERNFGILYMIDILILFIITGIFVSVISVILHKKRVRKLSSALQKISDGEFSVRLQQKKLNDTFTNDIIGLFNDMVSSLEINTLLSNDFINNFSHELKTPLNTISGFSKLLKDTGLSEEEKLEYLNIIIEESERLSRLSNNILMLSKLEKQDVLTDKTEYNLTEQLRQIVAVMYHKWNAKNIDIVFNGEEINISANREMLAQVWINLLDNAIKFSPENESIYINVIKNADCATVSIKNYGCSLTEEEISHIFDKFYQGPGEKKALGNGLGLTMVKKIIELHGGTVAVQCFETDCIIFTISIP